MKSISIFLAILAIMSAIGHAYIGAGFIDNARKHIATGNARNIASVCNEDGPIVRMDSRAAIQKYIDTCAP